MAGEVGRDAGHQALSFDPSVPNEGRMFDYYLGGKDNFAVDRAVAEQALEIAPELRTIAQESRYFLRRVVRRLASDGVRQFLDVGAGLPTQGNVNAIAAETAPDAHVVYVDNDPVVRVHAQALLEGDPGTAFIQADMREAGAILEHPMLRRLIDVDQPVALLFSAVLYTIPEDDEVARVVAGFSERLAPGSFLMISHPVSDPCPDVTARLARLYQQESNVIRGVPRPNVRTRTEVERLFTGWDLLAPGVVYLPQWDLDHPRTEPEPRWNWFVGGLARKP